MGDNHSASANIHKRAGLKHSLEALNRLPCFRSRKGQVASLVCSLLALICLLLWLFEVGMYQDHLNIVNGGNSTADVSSLVYKDCSHLSDTWGTIVSSHGIKNSATFLFVSSNGQSSPRKVDEYVLQTQCSVRPQALATVYVTAPHLHAFSKMVHLVPFPFVLLSGDADTTVPQDVRGWEDITECPNVVRWFAQNAGFKHITTRTGMGKLHYLPIGLDLHSLYVRASAVQHWGPAASPMEQTSQLNSIAAGAALFSQRAPRVYCNFHLNQPKSAFFFSDRAEAEKALVQKGSEVAYLQSTLHTRADTWREQSAYAFVASPHGVGLDCHRTWEALALGSVPVVKTGPLDSLYEGLPVLIVDSWESVTPELLRDKQKEMAANSAWLEGAAQGDGRSSGGEPTRPEKLTLQFWTDRVSRISLEA